MKASELIKELETLIEVCGDLEVEIPQTDNCYYGHTKINGIEIITTKKGLIIELFR